MTDSEEFAEGDPTVIATNRGNTIRITPCFAKKEPDGLWDDVFQALLCMGVFDDLL